MKNAIKSFSAAVTVPGAFVNDRNIKLNCKDINHFQSFPKDNRKPLSHIVMPTDKQQTARNGVWWERLTTDRFFGALAAARKQQSRQKQ